MIVFHAIKQQTCNGSLCIPLIFLLACQNTIFLLRPSLLQPLCPCWLTPALLVDIFAVAEGPASTAFIQALQDQLINLLSNIVQGCGSTECVFIPCQIMQCSCFKVNMRGIHVSHACCGMWPKPLHEHLTCSLNQASTATSLQTFWHGETQVIILIDDVAIVSSACMNMIFKPHCQQVSIPWHVLHVPWQPNASEVKASLRPFFFSAGNVLWSLCFVHIA